MPKQTVPYFKLSGGLNTEASPLNIEAADAIALSNIKFNNDGTIETRPPFDFILEQSDGTFYKNINDDFTRGTTFCDAVPAATYFQIVDTNGNLRKFVLLQVGRKLLIYDAESIMTLAEISNPLQEIDLTAYSNTECVFYKTRFVKDRNKVFIVNKWISLCYIALGDIGEFTLHTLDIKVRDTDKYSYDYGANWWDKLYLCIKTHTRTPDTEPGKGANWKDYWVVAGPENSSYLNWGGVDEYKSNIISLNEYIHGADDTTMAKQRFGSVAFACGRLWLSNYSYRSNTIYYSQTVTDDELLYQRMYSFADPLSTEDSTPVDTDGGFLVVNGADRILAITDWRGGVIAFANNGIWYISGGGGESFNHTKFSIDRISDDGIVGEDAWTRVENTVMYFGWGGAYILTHEDYLGSATVKLFSEKIKSFWNGIYNYSKAQGKAMYNPTDKKLYFLCNFTAHDWNKTCNPFSQNTHCRDVLIFDMALKAWYTYSLSDDTAGTKVSFGDMFTMSGGIPESSFVIDSVGDSVIDANSNIVLSYDSIFADSEFVNVPVLMKKNTATSSWDIAFGRWEGSGVEDFELNTVDKEVFTAYWTGAHQIWGDLIHQKQMPYLYILFKRIESGVLDEDGIDLTPGGCLMRIDWEWAINSKSTKYGTARQIYLPYRFNSGRHDGSEQGTDFVGTKQKVLGRGRVLQITFTKEGNKKFHIIGFNAQIGAKPII